MSKSMGHRENVLWLLSKFLGGGGIGERDV